MPTNVKKLIIAAMLLLGMTGLSLAQGVYGYGTYDYAPAYGYAPGLYDYAPGYPGGYTGPGGPWNYSGTPSGQPSPSSGIEAYR